MRISTRIHHDPLFRAPADAHYQLRCINKEREIARQILKIISPNADYHSRFADYHSRFADYHSRFADYHSRFADYHSRFKALDHFSLRNKYSLQQLLGQGGYGVAILAHTAHGDSVVIKIPLDSRTCLAMESLAIERMNRLSPRYTVRKIEFECKNHEKGPSRLVTEYGGTNVHDWCRTPSFQISIQKFLNFARSCMEFYRDLDAADEVLRDIKTDNMVVDADGNVRFIDYDMHGKKGEKHFCCGTLDYMSPGILTERFSSSEMPFALGCVLFEVLTGKTLFFPPMYHKRESSDSSSAAVRKCYTNIWLHLDAVFRITGHPSRDFGDSLTKGMRESLFIPHTSFRRMRLKPFSAEPPRFATLASFIQKIEQSIDPQNSPRVTLGDVDGLRFRRLFYDLVRKLLDFEHPISPTEALDHPFFKLSEPLVTSSTALDQLSASFEGLEVNQSPPENLMELHASKVAENIIKGAKLELLTAVL